MDNQRLILFIALSLVLLLLWQAWEQRYAPVAPPPPTAETPGVPVAPSAPAAPTAPTAPPKPQAALERGQRIEVVTDLLRAEIDTVGGDLRNLHLREYPVAVDQPDQPFQLLTERENEIYITQSGLIAQEGALPTHKSTYRAERQEYRLGPGEEQVVVPLTWSEGGVRVTKTYTFHRNRYLIDVRYTVENRGSRPREIYHYGQFVRTHVAPTSYLFALPTYTGGAIYTPDNKYEKVSFEDMVDARLARETTNGWIAMLQHYFVGAWIPPQEKHQFYTDTLGDGRYVLGYKDLKPLQVAPGGRGEIQAQLYLGPKEQDRLKAVAPGLVLTVDYGWLTFLAAPLFWVLEAIEDVIGNWGWAIILLTVLIKLVFYPLSAASYKSMAQMRKLQPRLQSLKESYGDDRAKMNQALMELYRKEKINPLGGCLPILIQIPVFIALYWVLLESVELRQAPFILWLRDLSLPDPYFVLPILMGITMVGQQLLNPQPLDPLQKKIMMALPVLFTVFFLFFPAGLVLYWLVNNILSIAQQWWITRRIEAMPTR